MLWSKLKNVILALLLFTNLFLLALVVSETMAEGELEQQTKETALLFLADRGIFVAESTLPTQALLQQELSNDRSQEPTYAQALLGMVTEEALGGEVYRYYNDQGEIRFHGNGEFSAYFQHPLHSAKESLPDHGAEILSLLGFQGAFLQQETEGDNVFLSYQQSIHDIPLIGSQVVLHYQNNSLMAMTQGKKIEGDLTPLSETNLSSASALIHFYHQLHSLGDVCSEIIHINPIYLLGTSTTIQLSPAWHITTDTGEYYLNLQSGAMSRKIV